MQKSQIKCKALYLLHQEMNFSLIQDPITWGLDTPYNSLKLFWLLGIFPNRHNNL